MIGVYSASLISGIRIKYGYLYNWYVTQGTGNASIIPSTMSSMGWDVPTYQNWWTLRDYNNGNSSVSGGILKEFGTLRWTSPNTGALDSYKFAALPGGLRHYDTGLFDYLHNQSFFACKYDGYYYVIKLNYNDTSFSLQQDGGVLGSRMGYSYRLVRTASTPEQLLSDGAYCLPYIGNDGTSYKTVKIGTQVWLAENLAETKYRGGIDITNVTDNTTWSTLTSGARCTYNNDENNVFTTSFVNTITSSTSIKYGYLYNWYAVSDVRKLTSSDTWKVADYVDGTTGFWKLIDYCGGNGQFAQSMPKMKSLDYWQSPNTGAENKFNFNLKPGGVRTMMGIFEVVNQQGSIWIGSYLWTAEYGAYTGYSAEDSKKGASIRIYRVATTPEQSSLVDGTWCEDYIGNDGRAYKTVKIGTQVWIIENLAETKYRDGSLIPNVTDNTAWSALTTGALCAYNNDASNVFETKFYYNLVQKNILYGFLYNWYTTQGTGSNSITSTDMWSVPTNIILSGLGTYASSNVGTSINAAKSLSSNSGWAENGIYGTVGNNQSINNYLGLNIVPSGNRETISSNLTYNAFIWSATEYAPTSAHYLNINSASSDFTNGYNNPKYYGYSIRLVRNATLQERGYADGIYCTPYIGNDGQSYKTVKIGTQVWLAENLIETKYRSGLNIVDTVDNTQWSALTQSSYCVYDNILTNSYGDLVALPNHPNFPDAINFISPEGSTPYSIYTEVGVNIVEKIKELSQYTDLQVIYTYPNIGSTYTAPTIQGTWVWGDSNNPTPVVQSGATPWVIPFLSGSTNRWIASPAQADINVNISTWIYLGKNAFNTFPVTLTANIYQKYVTISNDVFTHINAYFAYGGRPFTGTLTIPSSVTNIGYAAFYFAGNTSPGITRVNCKCMTAPIDAGIGMTLIGTARPLHVPVGATGYNIAPWTDPSIFTSIIYDL